MAARQIYLIAFALALLIGVLHAERVRYDDLEDDDDGNIDTFADERDDVIETFKRFLLAKKTTTQKPSSDSISALFTTTQSNRYLPTSSRSSIYGGGSKDTLTTKSKYDRTRATTAAPKDACGMINPCKNGGTCKTLSSGRYYCFCSQDYYGKNCESKFITSGAANKDRAPKDHCAKSPCRNNGECVGLRTTYYCRCKSPYYGTNCDKKFAKREEIVDESNSSEQELTAYERDLKDDNKDLREALGEQYYQ